MSPGHLLLHALLKQVHGLEPEDGEDHGAGVDGGEAIADGDDDDVLHAVLLRIVVRPEADDGAESQTEGVEHLVCSIKPHSRLQQHLHLGIFKTVM